MFFDRFLDERPERLAARLQLSQLVGNDVLTRRKVLFGWMNYFLLLHA